LSDFIVMLLLTGGSGACILVGGLAASVERIRPRWLESELRHSVIAFGGGVLLSAVALVLVPEGNEYVA
jgi:ZIP family zinc transporter